MACRPLPIRVASLCRCLPSSRVSPSIPARQQATGPIFRPRQPQTRASHSKEDGTTTEKTTTSVDHSKYDEKTTRKTIQQITGRISRPAPPQTRVSRSNDDGTNFKTIIDPVVHLKDDKPPTARTTAETPRPTSGPKHRTHHRQLPTSGAWRHIHPPGQTTTPPPTSVASPCLPSPPTPPPPNPRPPIPSAQSPPSPRKRRRRIPPTPKSKSFLSGTSSST